nr:hypothetical protein [Tanacetum cinerariifolium]
MYKESNLKCIKTLDKELEELKLEKDGLDGKMARLLKASKNLDPLIMSQRSDQVKEGVGYNDVPPPTADLYLSPKKDLSWTGLPEFMDDTVTDYNRPSPTVESTSAEGQIKDSSTSEDVASSNPPKPFVKSAGHRPHGALMRPPHRSAGHRPYGASMRPSHIPAGHKPHGPLMNPMRPNMNGPEFVLNKKACYNCGDFSHLANDCRKRVQRETSRSQNHAYMGPSHRSAGHRPYGAPMRPRPRSVGHKLHRASMRPLNGPAGHRPHGPSMNPIRPNMNVKTQYRAPWVSTVNRNFPPVNRKLPT